jgi:hypothetical protein
LTARWRTALINAGEAKKIGLAAAGVGDGRTPDAVAFSEWVMTAAIVNA